MKSRHNMRFTATATLLGFLLSLVAPGVAQTQVLTLEETRRKAIDNNKAIKEKELELEAAEHVKKSAFTNYFPKVDATAMAWKSKDPLIEADIPEMNLPVYDGNPANLQAPTEFAYFPGMQVSALDYMNMAALTAVQPLFAGGRIVNGNRLAKVGVEIRETQVAMSRTEAVVAAEIYYWNILALEEKRKTLDGYEALLKSLKNDVEAAFQAGIAQRSDVLKVDMELSKIETNRLALDNGITLLKKTLCQHIGEEYREDLVLESELGDAEDPSSHRVDSKAAVPRREEYKLLGRAVEAERLQKKIAVGESMPELAVGASLAAMDVMDETNANAFLFATFSVPISAWWGGYHDIKAHDAKVRAAESRLEDTAQMMGIQVDKTYGDLKESYKQYGVAVSHLRQAQEHLNVVSDNYEAGVVSTSDLLEAQAMRQEAENGIVDAKVRYRLAMLLYRQAINEVEMPE